MIDIKKRPEPRALARADSQEQYAHAQRPPWRPVAFGIATLLLMSLLSTSSAMAQVAVLGKKVHTMSGPPIENGVVLIRDGKIAMVGKADTVNIPDGFRILRAEVVTPGLIDAHSAVGFSGIFNHPHDQDQLEHSAPIQPDLRAIDGYNAREKLVEWVRGFGVTTLHTGHAPGELISGQTTIVETWGDTIDQAVIVDRRRRGHP